MHQGFEAKGASKVDRMVGPPSDEPLHSDAITCRLNEHPGRSGALLCGFVAYLRHFNLPAVKKFGIELLRQANPCSLRRMRLTKMLVVMAAMHLFVLGFLFYPPSKRYYVAIGLSTLIVWSGVTTLRSKLWLWVGIIGAGVFQLTVQWVAYLAWLSQGAANGWPLLQFICLQFLVVVWLTSMGNHRSP